MNNKSVEILKEVIVYLMDGRVVFGFMIASEDQHSYSIVPTCNYKEYLRTKGNQLIQILPKGFVRAVTKKS